MAASDLLLCAYTHTNINKYTTTYTHINLYIIATTIGWPRSGQADSLIVRPLGSSRGGRHPGWWRRRIGPALCRHGKVTGTFHSLTLIHTYIKISAYVLHIHTYIHTCGFRLNFLFFFPFTKWASRRTSLFEVALHYSHKGIYWNHFLSVQTESVCMYVCMYVCMC